ncbi:MAG TPA: M23 family metallopeptidase [Blastocatellia bacterium]|nr:M23 family metallopeptidase [Blastocatellia bacterium]
MNIPLAVLTSLLILSPIATGQARSARTGSKSASRVTLDVTSEPGVIGGGSPCLFRVKSRRALKSLSGEWQGRSVIFNYDELDKTWYGFAGVGIDLAGASGRLKLAGATAGGARFSYVYPVRIRRVRYRTVKLRVHPQYTEPDAETMARIKKEQELKKESFAYINPYRLWSGNFEAPVGGRETSEFGVHRTFNRKVQSIHQGMDFRAEVGTPVEAMNSGVVIIARDMFYEGGFVVIDHGQGLTTLYMHLSEIKVREGDSVAKRQIIGLSGETGRATAPHLHVGVRWQGIYLDPAVLLTIPLP